MCTVQLSHSKWLSKYSSKSASNLALTLNTPLWKLFGWFRRLQLWATGDGQLHHDNVPAFESHLVQSFLAKHQITQVTQLPYSPDLVPCCFWLFPKLKSPLKGKRFPTVDEIQENYLGQLMVTGRTVWGPRAATWKGTEASLSYVQCFLYLVSSLINVLIFHSSLLGSFWMDLLHPKGLSVTVLGTVFLVSCSINVSIFHIMWLDTFWTDLL